MLHVAHMEVAVEVQQPVFVTKSAMAVLIVVMTCKTYAMKVIVEKYSIDFDWHHCLSVSSVPPVPATNIDVVFGTTSATVSFTISLVVFDNEDYTVNYGLSDVFLDQSSTPITSDGNTEYTIQISGLLPGTTYYFQLSATNSISTTLSGVFSGTTLEEGKIVTNADSHLC